MAVAKNTDLSPSNNIPGFHVQLLFNSAGAGDENEPNTVMLLGERLSTGGGAVNAVYDLNSEQDAIDLFAQKSTVHRMYRALISQVGDGNVRVKACGVAEPSGGVAAVYKIVVSVPGTNPTAAGSIRLQICGDEVSVGYTTSDTDSTIGAALLAELNKLKNVPCTFAHSSGTITVTYNIKGAIGEDLPIRCFVNEKQDTGVYLGPGSLTYATAGSGSGSTRLTCGTQTATATLTDAGAGVGVTAADFATGMKAALAAGDYFVTGGTVATATLPLYYRNGRDIRRVSAAVLTTTGVTAQLTGGSATDGTGSANSVTYNGTLGTGLPTLTTALSNISNAGSFGEWVCPWASAGSSSTGLSAIATQIEAEANGEVQKNQHLTVCSVDSESTAAAIAAACTPALTGSLRYIIDHCPDAGQQGYELAARRAAMMAAWVTPATNSDSLALKTTAGVPLNLPALAVRATVGTKKAAITDGLEELVVSGGRLVILRGRTTTNSPDKELWDPSYIRQVGLHRRELKNEGNATFADSFVKVDGVINQTNDITSESVEDWAIGKLYDWESRGLYDGAEQLKSAVRAEIDADDSSRINLFVPTSPRIAWHQTGVVAAQSAPTI